MIYLWRIPTDYPEELIGHYMRKESPDRFLFRKGEELPSSIAIPRFEFNAPAAKLEQYDVLPNSTQIPLVSPKVAESLRGLCPNDIQLFEANIIASGQEIQGFKLLNATHLVSCVDHANSDYSFIPGTDAIMGFKKLKLVYDGLKKHHIAREAEYKSYLYVTEQVKGVFDSNKWQGCAFFPPESVHS